ncbi:ABC transporter substrate-binding protein [Streptosporangium sp. NPDC004379]|uniref:ABC transporter substrate-binding protein n=1 Tax=Streptosporangium sp. NPDC004379 TaxID=3366189 RepID=UPI0036C544B9
MSTKWTAVSLLAAAALTLSACGGSDTEAADAGGIRLTYAIFSTDQQPAMQKVVDAFEKDHPGIDVAVQVIPWTDYWTTLQNSAAGGTGPDVAWMLGSKIAPYADGGVLQPLDETISAAGTNLSAYPQQLLPLFKRDGKTYALPKDFDTIGLWYNKAIFDAAKLPHPNADWTWDDVVKNAKALTDKGKGVYGIAAPVEAQAGYYNTIYQAGGHVISPDGKTSGYQEPASLNGLRFWTDMIKNGYSPDLKSLSDTEAVAQFMGGKIAMYYSGSFYAYRFAHDDYTSKNVDVTELPAGVKEATVINGLGNVALASSKHPREAAELAVFLSGEQASRIQSETGTVLGSHSGTQQAWVDAAPQFNLRAFLDQLPNAVVYPVSENTDAWSSRESELLTPAWNGETSVEEAAKSLATAMNEALAQERQ